METVNIPKAEYDKLIADKKQADQDVNDLKEVVMGVMGVLGLAENGKPIPELFEEEPEIVGPCIKGITSVSTMMMKTKLPGPMGSRAEKELAQTFHFIKLIPPLLKRHMIIE